MTIKEIEACTGLPRSNIRYYETQGFLSPTRGGNGYRDYVQADVDTLLKIKLLRQLGFSLDAVHDIQAGHLELNRALEQREQALEQEQLELGQAAQLCRDMYADQVCYDTLEAQYYLDRLAQMPAILAQDQLPYAFCPVRRLMARFIDWELCHCLSTALVILLFQIEPPYYLFPSALSGPVLFSYTSDLPATLTLILPYLLLLVLEPLCLHFFSATPGKALMGLQLRGVGGVPLSYGRAMFRTGEVLVCGVLFFIPMFNLLPMWFAFRRCDHQRFQRWDVEQNGDPLDYLTVKPKLRTVFAALAILPICYFLPSACDFIAQQPPNRGDLTAEEFAENVNHLLRYEHAEVPLLTYLEEDGTWTIRQGTRFFFDHISYDLDQGPDGTLEQVGFSTRQTGWDEPRLYQYQMRLATLAFLAVQPGESVHRLERDGVLDAIYQFEGDSFHFERQGYTLDCTMEYEGYALDPDSGHLKKVPGAQDSWYCLNFSITKASA